LREPHVSGPLSRDSKSNSRSYLRTNQFSKTKRLLTERRALPGSGVSFDALPSSRFPLRASVWRGALSRWRRKTCQPLFSSTASREFRAAFDRLFGEPLFSGGGSILVRFAFPSTFFCCRTRGLIDLLVSTMLRVGALNLVRNERLAQWSAKSEKIGSLQPAPVGNLLKLCRLGSRATGGAPEISGLARSRRARGGAVYQLWASPDLSDYGPTESGGTITCRRGVRRQRRRVPDT
jgi:hypothetical protein